MQMIDPKAKRNLLYVSDFVLEQMQKIPTIEAVPVVKCKDCKYLGIKDFVYGYCKNKMCGIVRPNDFCSHGERKDGADNV